MIEIPMKLYFVKRAYTARVYLTGPINTILQRTDARVEDEAATNLAHLLCCELVGGS